MHTGEMIEAHRLGLLTSTGTVYANIDLAVPRGALAIIAGPARSGKTALLLTLAGRMVPSSGELRVGGVEGSRRRAIRRMVGLGEFHGVNDLDASLTVADQVRTELALHGRPWRGARREKVLATLCPDLDPHESVARLGAADRLLLGGALGMVAGPPILVLDELDEETTPAERAVVLGALRKLTSAGVTVVAGALDPALASEADVALCLDSAGGASPLGVLTSSAAADGISHALS